MKTAAEIDSLVRRDTAFDDMQDMIDHSKKGYTPTLRADINPELAEVAEAFDKQMAAEGYAKRAYLVLHPAH